MKEKGISKNLSLIHADNKRMEHLEKFTLQEKSILINMAKIYVKSILNLEKINYENSLPIYKNIR